MNNQIYADLLSLLPFWLMIGISLANLTVMLLTSQIRAVWVISKTEIQLVALAFVPLAIFYGMVGVETANGTFIENTLRIQAVNRFSLAYLMITNLTIYTAKLWNYRRNHLTRH